MSTVSLTVNVGRRGISITNAVLESNGHLTVYLSNNTTLDAGLTAFVEAVNYRDEAKTYSESASTSASTATTQATNAATSAIASSNSAISSATSATNSENSAINSATSATSSSNSATASASSASDANTSKINALASENNAKTSENNALTSADSASTSATSATNSATTASNSASSASTSATNASNSASSASTSATNSESSATSSSASASTATTQASNASISATNASASATAAAASATNAANVAKMYLQRSTTYTVGDVILGADNLSKQYALLCTASTDKTGLIAPTSWAAVNGTTTDGGATFAVKMASKLLPLIQATGTLTLQSYQTGSYINCTGSSAFIITMPSPASANGGVFVVRNAMSVGITLSTPSGTFIGPNGSQLSTLVIPANVIVELYTGGSNWVVTTWEASTVTGIEKAQSLGSLSANTTIDCTYGSVVSATINTDLTFSFIAASSTTQNQTLTLILTGAGSHVVTWPSSVKWTWGLAPTFSTGTDIVTFMTTDNGITWYGSLNGVTYA
jgi:hypothetical protein